MNQQQQLYLPYSYSITSFVGLNSIKKLGNIVVESNIVFLIMEEIHQ